MEWFVQNYLSNTEGVMNVLDVGSYDVNGGYKHFFTDKKFQYTGLDIAAGPNVDIVPQCPYLWKEIESESFDVVISGQAFEHIEFPWLTISEIARVLKKNGLLCIIVPRLSARHRYPVDTYRYDTDGIIALARYAGLTALHASMNLGPKGCIHEFYSNEGDTMLIAKKPSSWMVGGYGCIDIESYVCIPSDLGELATGFIDYKSQNFNVIIRLLAYIKKRRIRFAKSVRKRLKYFRI